MPNHQGSEITQLKTVDMTRRQCHVAFQDVAVAGAHVIGEVGQGWPILKRVLDQAIAGLCTEMGRDRTASARYGSRVRQRAGAVREADW